MFTKGQSVSWKSGPRDYTGEVVAVVPKGERPIQFVDAEELRRCNIKPLGLIASQQPRDHETYLVKALVGDRGIEAIYWPAVSSLKLA